MYLPKDFQYSAKSKRVLLKPPCRVFFITFSNTGGELDVPMVHDAYYEFTKSSERLENFGVLPQNYCHKNCWTMFTTHFSRKEKKYGKRSLNEQVEPNLNISEDENQRGQISNTQ